MNICRWVIGIFALMIVVAAAPVEAQIVHGQKPELTQGLTFLSWDVTGDTAFTIQEWHVPVIVRAGLRENLELAVYGALVNAEADWNREDNDINGLTDAKVQVSASLMNDQLLLSGGLSLPTGQTELTRDEQALLSWLASDFLNFPIKNPGEGMNVFGQVGFATPAGQWVLGMSSAAYLAGKYTPYDNNHEYQPGSRYVFNAGAEREWPSRHRASVDFIFIYSSDDKVDGKSIFRDGVQLDSRLSGRLAVGKGDLEGGIRYVLRAKDKTTGDGDALVSELNNRHGDDFRLYALGHLPLGGKLAGWASVDAKFLAANDYPPGHPFFEDKARLTGIGGGLDFGLGPRSKAGIGVKVWNGTSDGALGQNQLDFSGLEITQYFSVTF